MAFTTRSARGGISSTHPPPGTSTSLGPGVYNADSKPSGKVSYAPFTSSSERNGPEVLSYAPGPGEYEHPSARALPKTRASSATFISRTNRSTKARPKTADVPGPGSYQTRNAWIKKRSKPRKQRRAENSVAWVKVNSSPSIPTNKESYGYETNKAGDLVLQAPPVQGFAGEHKSIAGPGEYNPYREFGVEGRGTNWHRSRVHRIQNAKQKKRSKQPKQAPILGPGEYHHDKVTNVADESNRKSGKRSASYISKRDRLPKTKPKDTPGPGAYMAISGFAKALEETTQEFQFFGSKTERSHVNRRLNSKSEPGPATYHEHLIKDVEEANGSTFQGGFHSTSTRFTRPKSAGTAGPGQYHDNLPHTNMGHELSKKVFGRNSSFGATEERMRVPKPTSADAPPVGTYQEKKLVRPIAQNSVFASTSSRMKKVEMTDSADAGSYNPKTTSREVDESRSSASFANSTRQEYQPGVHKKATTNTVGPGTYKVQGNIKDTSKHRGNKASFHSSEPRLKSSKEGQHIPSYNSAFVNNPGPGTYDATNTDGRSFNISVGS